MTFIAFPMVAQSYLGISGYSEIGSQNMILDSKFRIFGSILRSDRTKKLETPLFRGGVSCQELSKCVNVYVILYHVRVYIVVNASRRFRFALQNYIFSFIWPNV